MHLSSGISSEEHFKTSVKKLSLKIWQCQRNCFTDQSEENCSKKKHRELFTSSMCNNTSDKL